MQRLAAAACTFAILAIRAPAGQAQQSTDITGDWVLRPVRLVKPPQLRGCFYKQTLKLGETKGGAFSGTAHTRIECRGNAKDVPPTPITATVAGNSVTVTSSNKEWTTERLTLQSPTLMQGRDASGYTLIYERNAPGRPPRGGGQDNDSDGSGQSE
jgi:hypothetical protein